MFETAPTVNRDPRPERIAAGLAPGAPCRSVATTPATCGEACDVPSPCARAVVEELNVLTMSTPGAKTSTQEPKFEKPGLESVESTAPTVMASGTRAGDSVHASTDSFPAATTTGIPALIAACTASSTALDDCPPRLMLTTDRP